METTQTNEEEILRKVCEKRQQLYALLLRSLEENSRRYDEEMTRLHQEIDQLWAVIKM